MTLFYTLTWWIWSYVDLCLFQLSIFHFIFKEKVSLSKLYCKLETIHKFFSYTSSLQQLKLRIGNCTQNMLKVFASFTLLIHVLNFFIIISAGIISSYTGMRGKRGNLNLIFVRWRWREIKKMKYCSIFLYGWSLGLQYFEIMLENLCYFP